MARADLDAIQSKLKVAIQNHQKLVVKMKADPENAGLRSQIHHLQGEIMLLSDEQKTIVQNLRQELVKQQPIQVSASKPVNNPASQTRILPRPTQIQTQAIILPTNMTPAFSLTVPAAHVKGQIVTTVPVQQLTAQLVSSGKTVTIKPATGQTLQATGQTLQATDLSCKMVWTTVPQKITVNNNNSVQLKATPLAVNVQVTRSSSPPIRVPQYHVVTSKSSVQPTQVLNTQNDNRMPPPEMSKTRKPSDSSVMGTDIKDIKKPCPKQYTFSPEEKKKIEFMAALDLVSPDSLKELQVRRTERKRRSTANPQFTYHFEPTRKKANNYLANSSNHSNLKRPRGRPRKSSSSPTDSPNTPDSSDSLTGFFECQMTSGSCAVCGKVGDVLMCSTCSLVYHLKCLKPPLESIPVGNWSCPKCLTNGKAYIDPASLSMVNSYITAKAAKEDEKRKLQKKTTELTNERTQLEAKSKQLQETFQRQVQQNHNLRAVTKKTRQSIENLKNLMKAVQSS